MKKYILTLLVFSLAISAYDKEMTINTYKGIRAKNYYINETGEDVTVRSLSYSCEKNDCNLKINGKEVDPNKIKVPGSKPSPKLIDEEKPKEKKVSMESSTSDFSLDMIKEITKEHNKTRENKSLNNLDWSDEVAKYAKNRVESIKENNCENIENKLAAKFKENSYSGKQNLLNIKEIVSTWSSEGNYFNLETNSCESGKNCSNYLNLISPKFKFLGCAKVSCSEKEVWICNYL